MTQTLKIVPNAAYQHEDLLAWLLARTQKLYLDLEAERKVVFGNAEY